MNRKSLLIVGNWKAWPRRMRDFVGAHKGLQNMKLSVGGGVEVAVAPPYPYLSLVKKSQRMLLAAQDVFWEPEGSYTGEVTAPMLKEFGVKYVIVGHSERRMGQAETDVMIQKKVAAAAASGLYPILCVGEAKRDSEGMFFQVIREQIEMGLKKTRKAHIGRISIAYEPVWAVGTGRPAKPKDVNEAALFIKRIFAQLYGLAAAKSLRVLYGGSVDAKNAMNYLKEREVGGFLVGKESRNPKSFGEIIRIAYESRQ